MGTSIDFKKLTEDLGLDDDCPLCGERWPDCRGLCAAHGARNNRPGPFHGHSNDDCCACRAENYDHPAAAPEGLAGYAREDEGQCRHRSTWRTRVEDYDWHHDPALPVALIRAGERGDTETAEGARAWLAEEGRTSGADGCRAPGYYADLAEWWLADPTRAPITVSRVGAGYWVWGGYHRHAVAVAHGLLTVPAAVGVPKTVAGPDAHEGRPKGVR